MDIQKRLDDLLSDNPEAQKYIDELWYIAPGKPTPDGVTHTVRLSSEQSPVQREITVGLVVKAPYAAALDAILASAATQPRQG